MTPRAGRGDGSRLMGRPAAGQPAIDPAAGLAAVRRGEGLTELAALADGCRACPLWAAATQTVFGDGPAPARMMLIGEQPGDEEDRIGTPFVGPAGRELNELLDRVGIDRERVFVTNVVKHFKWRPSGKRRLHDRPNRSETRACRPWLDAELELVAPDTVVLLGATAAQAVLGPAVRVSQTAGRPIPSGIAPTVVATIHPSAILRARSSGARRDLRERLVADLRLAATSAAESVRR